MCLLILVLYWNGNLSHYYFHIAGLLRGQNQPVNQVTAAALVTKMAKNVLFINFNLVSVTNKVELIKSEYIHIFLPV